MRNKAVPYVGSLPAAGSTVRLRKHAGGPLSGIVVGHRPLVHEQRGELLSLGLGVLVDWGDWYRSTEYPDDLAVAA